MKRFATDRQRRAWLAWREKVRSEALALFEHHVHVGSTQRIGNRMVYRGSCTCGVKTEFTLSLATAEKMGGIELMVEMDAQHRADMIFDLIDTAVAKRRVAKRRR